jgi:hypothetical protein
MKRKSMVLSTVGVAPENKLSPSNRAARHTDFDHSMPRGDCWQKCHYSNRTQLTVYVLSLPAY